MKTLKLISIAVVLLALVGGVIYFYKTNSKNEPPQNVVDEVVSTSLEVSSPTSSEVSSAPISSEVSSATVSSEISSATVSSEISSATVSSEVPSIPVTSEVPSTTTLTDVKSEVETQQQWTETPCNKVMYIKKDGTNSRAKAIQGATVVKSYKTNAELKVIATTNTGYCKLSDGSFIHSDFLSATKIVVSKPVTPSTPSTPTSSTGSGNFSVGVNEASKKICRESSATYGYEVVTVRGTFQRFNVYNDVVDAYSKPDLNSQIVRQYHRRDVIRPVGYTSNCFLLLSDGTYVPVLGLWEGSKGTTTGYDGIFHDSDAYDEWGEEREPPTNLVATSNPLPEHLSHVGGGMADSIDNNIYRSLKELGYNVRCNSKSYFSGSATNVARQMQARQNYLMMWYSAFSEARAEVGWVSGENDSQFLNTRDEFVGDFAVDNKDWVAGFLSRHPEWKSASFGFLND